MLANAIRIISKVRLEGSFFSDCYAGSFCCSTGRLGFYISIMLTNFAFSDSKSDSLETKLCKMILGLVSRTLKGSSFFTMILRQLRTSLLITSFNDDPLMPYFLLVMTEIGSLSRICLYYLSNCFVGSSQAYIMISTDESLTFYSDNTLFWVYLFLSHKF